MLAGLLGSLLNCAEFALLGEVSSLFKSLLLLGCAVLNTGHNATVLVHHKVCLGEAATGLVSSSVPNLSARALKHLKLLAVNVVHSIILFLSAFNHFNYT